MALRLWYSFCGKRKEAFVALEFPVLFLCQNINSKS